jgi:hypothetical protein
MTDVSKQILMGNKDFFPIKPVDYGKFMILSLGTGTAKIEEKFDAAECSKWGLLGWLSNRGATPIIDSFSQASGPRRHPRVCAFPGVALREALPPDPGR